MQIYKIIVIVPKKYYVDSKNGPVRDTPTISEQPWEPEDI